MLQDPYLSQAAFYCFLFDPLGCKQTEVGWIYEQSIYSFMSMGTINSY